MADRLERAPSGRARCAICELTIALGELRVAEDVARFHHDSVQFSHWACVVHKDLNLAQRALFAPSTGRELREAALPVLDADAPQLAKELRHSLSPVAPSATTTPVLFTFAPQSASWSTEELLLIQKLIVDPEDRATLAVLGDALQNRGDPRGELIALELSGSNDAVVSARRAELQAMLTPELRSSERSGWRLGFLSILRVELGSLREALFTHPSAALLRELTLGRGDSEKIPFPAISPALRKLALSDLNAGPLLPKLAAFPHLAQLEISSCNHLTPFAHPTLAALSFSRMPVEEVLAQFPSDLPRLERLTFDWLWLQQSEDLVAGLCKAGWLKQLKELTLRRVPLGEADIDLLARALDKRKLQRLDVSETGLPRRCAQPLQQLCDELVFPDGVPTPETEWWIHTGKPEWGRGKIVSTRGDSIELRFESGGDAPKRFKVGSPFLKLADG